MFGLSILHMVIGGWPPQPPIFHWVPFATALSFIGANKKPFEAGLQHWQLNNDYNNISPFSDTNNYSLEEIG